MNDCQTIELKIDKVFKTLIPPLSAEEYRQLEENLLSEPCLNPICIWNDIIIDGHNRYEVCKRYNLVFATKEIFMQIRHEVIAWKQASCMHLATARAASFLPTRTGFPCAAPPPVLSDIP